MTKIERFEHLVAWQVAREVTREIYAITRAGRLNNDRTLVDQMRRAAISIISNIAEGFERESNPDRLRFYSIAKASCAELRSQLYIAFDAGYLDASAFTVLQEQADRLARLIGGLRSAIRRNLPARNSQYADRNGERGMGNG